jgi:hypothetical protein
MTQNLAHLVGRRLCEIPAGPDYTRPHPHTSVGIEIEVEKMPARPPDFKRWTVDNNEGSLINGLEYVSDPVWGTAITDALNEIGQYFEEHRPYVSFRCSVHIHVNVLDMAIPNLKRLLELGVIYEPSFFRLHDTRRDNIFCVPTASSYKIQQGLAAVMKHLGNGAVADGGYIPSKYAAININNLGSLGTIEYRHMAGSINMQEISDWIDILLQMKTAALLNEDIYDPSEVWGSLRDKLDIRPEDLDNGRNIINHLSIWR